MEKQYREGEVVDVTLVNEDSEGKVMSEVTIRWYGMDNIMANAMAIDVVDAIAEKSKQWGEMKASGNAPKGSIR